VDHAGHHRGPQGARRNRGRAEGEGVGGLRQTLIAAGFVACIFFRIVWW
jgi:hypothetical protein